MAEADVVYVGSADGRLDIDRLQVYDGMCRELEPRLIRGTAAAQAAFRPFMGRRDSLETEAIASQMLLTRLPDGRSLRDVRRPIHGNTVDYYGITFELPGLPDGQYSSSELEMGILAIVNEDNGHVDRVAIVHPDRINYQDPRITRARARMVAPAQLDAELLGGRRIPGFVGDAEAFFADFHDFFAEEPWHEKPSGIPGLVDLLPTGNAVNLNAFSFEAKYYLWKLLFSYRTVSIDGTGTGRQEHELDCIEAFFSCAQQAGLAGEHMVVALDGDRDLIIRAGQRLLAHVEPEFWALAAAVANAERFVVESSWALLPDVERGRYQERVNVLLPLIRGMAREAMERFASAQDSKAVLGYHRLGFAALAEMIGYVFAAHHPDEEAPPVSFSTEDLDSIREGARLAPMPSITHGILVRHQYAKAMYAQRNVSVADRQAWLRAFYERVIAAGIYETKLAAEYKDVSGLEEERYRNALVTLHQKGLLPKGARLLSVGCGDGSMEGRVYEWFARHHPDALPGEIIGIDLFPQGSETFWARKTVGNARIGFFQTSLEDVRETHSDGSFDLIVLIGSPLNNMDLLVMQTQYFRTLNRLLKPGGIVMVETGLAEPAREVNERWRAIQDFSRLMPGAPLGSIGIKPAYQAPGDSPEDVGAYLYLSATLEQLGRESGLRMIAPASMEALVAAGDDPRKLIRWTKERPDAFEQPVYVANPPHEWDGGAPLNIRGALFFRKEREPMESDPFLDSLSHVRGQKAR